MEVVKDALSVVLTGASFSLEEARGWEERGSIAWRVSPRVDPISSFRKLDQNLYVWLGFEAEDSKEKHDYAGKFLLKRFLAAPGKQH